MAEKLFIDDVTVCDETYRIIRDEDRAPVAELRSYILSLWGTYHNYADRDFRRQLTQDFDARFWEMYLTCTLIDKSFNVVPKRRRARGPDIRIEYGSTIIWVEAVTPTVGDSSKPDSVPPVKMGVAQQVPDEQMTLRYRSAIQDKCSEKYFTYLRDGIIRRDDCYVVALNGCRMPWPGGDYEPPRIIRSVLPFGWQVVSIDVSSHRIVNTGNQYRAHLRKVSGHKVDTDIFVRPEYSHISAVMFSETSIRNLGSAMGEDFITVDNPLASRKLPEDFPKVGRRYEAELSEKTINVSWRKLGHD
jgi:type I restriction enzyme S subunit